MKRKHILFIVFAISLFVGFAWESVPIIKNSVHSVLSPSFGALLSWNVLYGMLIILGILSLIMSLIHKYATDQKEMKKLKKEQKELQKKVRECQNDPKKMKECQGRQMELFKQSFSMSLNPMMYTLIPFILFFRFFQDYFSELAIEIGEEVIFLGIFNWFWFYFVCSMVFSMIWRKILKIS